MATPEELVAKALESLSPEERQQATAWLLRRSSTRTQWFGRSPQPDPLHSVFTGQGLMELYSRGLLAGPPSADRTSQLVPVPVRLPAELHTRLRDWSADNGFSMATVVRGLVSRFLDSQAAPES